VQTVFLYDFLVVIHHFEEVVDDYGSLELEPLRGSFSNQVLEVFPTAKSMIDVFPSWDKLFYFPKTYLVLNQLF
jgi:hypothetical protein